MKLRLFFRIICKSIVDDACEQDLANASSTAIYALSARRC
jgi:hypothetical protein